MNEWFILAMIIIGLYLALIIGAFIIGVKIIRWGLQ